MTKVYPNAANAKIAPAYEPERLKLSGSDQEDATVLTVWKKSLLLNCNGFTVFDNKGNLVFRVDNYLAGHKGEIVLMDACGKPLLTIRRKRLSLGDNWVVYDGETAVNPLFCVRKNVSILNNNKCLAHVTSANNGKGASKYYDNKNAMLYQVEGSYGQRCCAVYDNKRRRVAEIKRKEAAVGGVALGVDVFRLIVQPEIDTSVAMAFVILLDQMYGTSSFSRRSI
ncbi:protein LURP-one-related 8 [Prunus yedoensis var. nudiflora]|uniref:Protein LURP-one-related 8 n=1 Tax=Prunus yedoensis var. nudiflora TaxID=2094558 RepID=A0A314YLJ3_PRUYE|nr:protein LURP-one-related 8 [Prunus yedoensis var. nudiflora]